MEGSLKELSMRQLEKAREMLSAAEENLRIGHYRTSLNRSYYAVFHAMRAVNATDGIDSSKHSGVIAHFNQNYIKSGKLDRGLVSVIKSTSHFREKSDYDDFYVTSEEEAEEQLQEAKAFVCAIEGYLEATV